MLLGNADWTQVGRSARSQTGASGSSLGFSGFLRSFLYFLLREAPASLEESRAAFLGEGGGGFCFTFVPTHFWESEIHKGLLQLKFFHVPLQPRPAPAPTSHQPVDFYSRRQPSTFLSAIFYISPALFLNFHSTPSSAQAQRR